MKNYIYIFVLFFCTLYYQSAFSQSLVLVGSEVIEKSASIQEEYEIQVLSTIKNISLSDITVKLKIEVIEMPYGHSFGACWAGGCLSTSIFTWDSETFVVLPAMTQMPDYTFVGHYYCTYKSSDCTPGQGKFRYTFYDAKNPADSTSLLAILNFTGGNGITESISDSDIDFKYLTGNQLNIIPKNFNKQYTCMISNLSGDIVETRTFSEEIFVNMNQYSAGAYLYTVFTNSGKIAAKGKMLVN